MIRNYFAFILTAWLLFVSACSSKKQPAAAFENEAGTLGEMPDSSSLRLPEPLAVSIEYSVYAADSLFKHQLSDSLNKSAFKIILALNRLDERSFFRSDSLVMPDTFYDSLIYYATFPRYLASAASIKKLLLVSARMQSFAAYENGRLVRWGPVSSGKRSSPSPSGLFHTNWKAKKTISTVNEEWELHWYFNLTNKGGVSMHEYSLPGYPASHACIRLWEEDARWMYYWAEQWILSPDQMRLLAYGSPVLVFDPYPFGQRRSWRKLNDERKLPEYPSPLLDSILQSKLPLILQRQAVRDSIQSAELAE